MSVVGVSSAHGEWVVVALARDCTALQGAVSPEGLFCFEAASGRQRPASSVVGRSRVIPPPRDADPWLSWG